jgi:GNAT superfamily N-acetyltransferase
VHQPLLLDDPAALATFEASATWPALTVETIAQHAPDAALVVPGEEGPRARCSLWWTAAPPLDGHRVGAIGHYAASDAVAARTLLDAACAELARRGCTIAVGPMDGNTWRGYRLVTEPGTEPPFLLEPTNPPEWPGHWTSAGFAPLAHYSSSLNTALDRPDERAAVAAGRLRETGITLRPLDLDRFDDELARIHAVAAVSFRDNFLYTPLPEAAFAAQYRQLRPVVVPGLVLVAEDGDRPVGFAFTLPDLLERQRGGPVRTVIIKTVAILPERRRLGGLGSWMVDETQRAAHAMGFRRAVHALMHDGNASRTISARTGAPMRGYTLYARPLT